MMNHSIFSVQTICLLIMVGHNIGESDRISVLLACGVRIAQCLGLHRLGAEPSFSNAVTSAAIERCLIDREVSKRVWWFLIRQDWLQIPFMNTYSIHPTQFNTPMPKTCHDDASRMIVDGKVIHHDPDVYTEGSYINIINQSMYPTLFTIYSTFISYRGQVAVLIWKTQDRMCRRGHPQAVEDGLRKLYTEVLNADQELRQLMDDLPRCFRNEASDLELPPHLGQQYATLQLTLAHKVSISIYFETLL